MALNDRVTQVAVQSLSGADAARKDRITQVAVQSLTGADPARRGRVTQVAVQALISLQRCTMAGNMDGSCTATVYNAVHWVTDATAELSASESLTLPGLTGSTIMAGNMDGSVLVQVQGVVTMRGNVDAATPVVDLLVSGLVAELSSEMLANGVITPMARGTAELSASMICNLPLGVGEACLEPTSSGPLGSRRRNFGFS